MAGRAVRHGAVYLRPTRRVQQRLFVFAVLPLALVVIGTLGYWLLDERYTLFDALYMTAITLTTIGYGEVHPLTASGRIFTMVLLASGVFTCFYSGTEVLRLIVSGEIQDYWGRQRMERQLAQLRGHTIICGFGRLGRMVCQQLSKEETAFVVIDSNEELLADFTMAHGIALHGDATSDAVLRHAGIDHAQGLVTVMPSDADNLYTTMSARLLNRELFIVARVEDPQAEVKLQRAGANRVVSPYQIGGFRLAQAILRPTVVDFIELASENQHIDLQIEEAKIGPQSRLAGKALRDSGIRADLKLIIVAVKKEGGQMLFNPAPELRIETGDILVAIGPRDQLDQLDALAR